MSDDESDTEEAIDLNDYTSTLATSGEDELDIDDCELDSDDCDFDFSNADWLVDNVKI